MSHQPTVEASILELELILLQSGIRNSARVADILAENFVEFSSSGLELNKTQVIACLQAESPCLFTASQFNVRMLAPNIALVTYRAHRHSTPPVHSLRTSIWEQKQGKWKIIFHQGTLMAMPQ